MLEAGIVEFYRKAGEAKKMHALSMISRAQLAVVRFFLPRSPILWLLSPIFLGYTSVFSLLTLLS